MLSERTTSSSRNVVFFGRLFFAVFTIALAWPMLKPLVVTSLVSRSDMFAIYGRYGDAERYLARARWLDPRNSRVVSAEAFIDLGGSPSEMTRARAHLLPLAKVDEVNGQLWLDLAIIDAKLKHYDDARAEISVALQTLHDPTTKKFADVLRNHR